MKPPIVTVFGSSQPAPGSPAYQTAYDLGQGIAQAGWTLCNGGYGGTMEASAHGAVQAGGHTIGVSCSIFGRASVNQFIKQEVTTFYLLTRLDTLVRLGRAYVVLPGGTGTLLELALVWELLNKRLLRRNAPIILIGDTWCSVVDVIRREQPETLDVQVVATAELAIEALREHFAAAQPAASTG